MKKKFISSVIAVALCLLFVLPASAEDNSARIAEIKAQIAELQSELDELTGTTEEGFDVEFGLEFLGGVPEDNTGKWYLYETDKTVDAYDYAIDFCEMYCGNVDSVSAIINTSDNTTTRLNYSPDNGGSVTVTVLEHVDGEEESAKTLFSGKQLKSRVFDISTGFYYDYDTGESGHVDTQTDSESK